MTPESGRSPGEGNGNPLQDSCLENSMDREAEQATVHGISKSWTDYVTFTFTFFSYLFYFFLNCSGWYFQYYVDSKWREWTSCFVSNFKGKAFHFSLLSMLVVGLPYVAFVMLRNVPSTPTLLRVFIINRWLNFVKFIFCIIY